MRRGEVWWAQVRPPSGHRPVVLISRDATYAIRESVTVAPVTSRIRGISVEVPLGLADGVPSICAVNLDNVTTIPKDFLQRPITTLNSAKLQAVDSAIHFALGQQA